MKFSDKNPYRFSGPNDLTFQRLIANIQVGRAVINGLYIIVYT